MTPMLPGSYARFCPSGGLLPALHRGLGSMLRRFSSCRSQVTRKETMKNQPLCTLLAGAILVLLIGCGTFVVQPDPANKLVGKGAEYYLPRTVLVAHLPVAKTTKMPGRFYFFCEPLLEMEPTVDTASVSFKVGDEAALEVIG